MRYGQPDVAPVALTRRANLPFTPAVKLISRHVQMYGLRIALAED